MLTKFWYVAATAAEITSKPLARTLLGVPLVLFRTETGKPAALVDMCSHRRAPLSHGRVSGEVVVCPYHGIEFAADGRCMKIPTQKNIPPSSHVRAYQLVERYGFAWIWMDESEGDPAAIPELPWRADPQWNNAIVQRFHIQSPARLTMENLLDLSHVAFIHQKTIAFSADRLADDPLVMEVDGDCIRNTRVFPDVDPPPAHRTWRNFKGKVDRSSISEWRPPGYISILVRNADADGAIDQRFDHFLTPETDETHHYFVGVARNFQIDDAELTHKIDEDSNAVHIEDKDMIEAQYRTILQHPGSRSMILRQDQPIARAEAILNRLQKQSESA